jgi:hypothetical protein
MLSPSVIFPSKERSIWKALGAWLMWQPLSSGFQNVVIELTGEMPLEGNANVGVRVCVCLKLLHTFHNPSILCDTF